MSKDTPVLIACAIAITFLAASYIKGHDMQIQLSFINQHGEKQVVSSEWPSFDEAVAWARKFMGASTVVAKAL